MMSLVNKRGQTVLFSMYSVVVVFFVMPGQHFFSRFHGQQESFYDEELLRFKSITTPEQMIKHELFETFRFVLWIFRYPSYISVSSLFF